VGFGLKSFTQHKKTPIRVLNLLDSASLQLLVLELLELRDDLIQGANLSLSLAVNIITATDINRVGGLLLGTNHKDEVELRNLGVADFLVQSRVRGIDVRKESGSVELLLDLLGIGDQSSSHWNHLDLAGGQPEVPSAGTGLCENGNHALQRTQHGTMNNNGAREVRSLATAVAVLETETLGQLEVQLDGGALMAATQAVTDQNINLGSVECTILRVNGPGASEAVKCISQMLELKKAQLLVIRPTDYIERLQDVFTGTQAHNIPSRQCPNRK